MKNISKIRDLLDKIRQLKSKNHGVLSVEDVKVLDECEAVLKQLVHSSKIEKSEENLKEATRVVGLIIRLLLGFDLF